MKLEIGDKIELFEKGGLEYDFGKIIHLDSDFIYVQGEIRKYKIPHKSLKKELILTTRANSLKNYEI